MKSTRRLTPPPGSLPRPPLARLERSGVLGLAPPLQSGRPGRSGVLGLALPGKSDLLGKSETRGLAPPRKSGVLGRRLHAQAWAAEGAPLSDLPTGPSRITYGPLPAWRSSGPVGPLPLHGQRSTFLRVTSLPAPAHQISATPSPTELYLHLA